MPIYEYKCNECGVSGEVIQPIGAPPHTCPNCGIDMERIISCPAILEKGKARRKWAENWTPDSPKFHTGSLRGEKY